MPGQIHIEEDDYAYARARYTTSTRVGMARVARAGERRLTGRVLGRRTPSEHDTIHRFLMDKHGCVSDATHARSSRRADGLPASSRGGAFGRRGAVQGGAPHTPTHDDDDDGGQFPLLPVTPQWPFETGSQHATAHSSRPNRRERTHTATAPRRIFGRGARVIDAARPALTAYFLARAPACAARLVARLCAASCARALARARHGGGKTAAGGAAGARAGAEASPAAVARAL
jgi:hypothetical protein